MAAACVNEAVKAFGRRTPRVITSHRLLNAASGIAELDLSTDADLFAREAILMLHCTVHPRCRILQYYID